MDSILSPPKALAPMEKNYVIGSISTSSSPIRIILFACERAKLDASFKTKLEEVTNIKADVMHFKGKKMADIFSRGPANYCVSRQRQQIKCGQKSFS